MDSEMIKKIQITALYDIKYCYDDIKKQPMLQYEDILNNKIKSRESATYNNNAQSLITEKKEAFLEYYASRARFNAELMLIINYLTALLINSPNNNTTIYKNIGEWLPEIKLFEKENEDLLNRLKIARNKLFAHIDLNWQEKIKNISLDEIELCINFLNDLFEAHYPDFYLLCEDNR